MESMPSLLGMRVIVSEHLPKFRLEQFRFPRSKRVRIRKKWAKDRRNFRKVDLTNQVYFLGPSTIMVRPEVDKELRRACGLATPNMIGGSPCPVL